MKIGSIVIACYKFDEMLAFWQEALHYAPREPAKGGWVVLRDPERRRPNLSLNQVPNKRSGRSRLHLDLYTHNREGEVERLLKSRSGRLAILGGISRMMTLSCWKIPMATSSAWFRSQARLKLPKRTRARLLS